MLFADLEDVLGERLPVPGAALSEGLQQQFPVVGFLHLGPGTANGLLCSTAQHTYQGYVGPIQKKKKALLFRSSGGSRQQDCTVASYAPATFKNIYK